METAIANTSGWTEPRGKALWGLLKVLLRKGGRGGRDRDWIEEGKRGLKGEE